MGSSISFFVVECGSFADVNYPVYVILLTFHGG